MKLFLLVLLVSLSSCTVASTTIRGKIKQKEFAKLRATARLVDNYQPKLQNLCTSGKTFKLGEDCEVSFALEDLEPTSGKHVFKSHACGEEDDTIIVTLDLEDEMPLHAARLNQRSMTWTELVAMPHLEEHGCMYTTVANADVDPKKVEKRRIDGDERTAHGGHRNLKISTLTSDGVVQPVRHAGRQLQACSEYKVIRMAVRYDSVFCNDHGGGTQEGAVAVANTIIEMMNPFFKVAPLCMKVELCSIEGSCSVDNDPYASMISESTSVCDLTDDNDLLDNFRALFHPRPPEGCDTTHLFGGGDPFPNDTIGCAEVGALCNEFSVAINFMPLRYLFIDYVWLVSHELGHNLGALHVLGEDQYIMSYGERPDRFKLENINRMVDYVNQVHAQDSTCTVTKAVGPPTLAPTAAPCSGSEFRLVLQTDEYGEETKWDVTEGNGNIVVQGNGYWSNSRYEIIECLPSGTDYTFTIRDTYGDGICCVVGDGNYEIYIDGTLIHSSNGQFGSEEVVPLSEGSNISLPTPRPNPSPTPAPVPSPTPVPVPDPTVAPVPSPTLAPVPNPTSPPVNGPTDSCNGHAFRLEMQTDEWGDEVTWQLQDPNGHVVVQGGNYPSGETSSVDITECLQNDGVHIFKIMDSSGDGMCCDAYYKLWYDGSIVIYYDGQYGQGETVTVPGGDVNAAPSGSPNQSPVVSPTPGGSCNGGHEFRLELQTDMYGDEVSWELQDPNGNVVIHGGNYPSGENFIQTAECLSGDGVHIFKIMDSYGDGMIGDAHYKLWYDGNVVIYHDGQYGYGESITVPGGHVF